MIVGVAVAALAIHQLSNSSSGPARHGKVTAGAPEDLGIPYGATPTQVVRHLGQPRQKRSSCWIYDVKDGAKLIGDGFGQWVDAVKYCFSEGPTGGRAVSVIQSHMVAHKIGKRHFPAGWSHVTIAIAPPPAS